jgi:hypothetical protein
MIDSTCFHIGDDPQLFVDDVLIEAVQGLTRRWHKPTRHGAQPLIRRDRPWERSLYFTYSNYAVIRDPADGVIKCWYEDLGEVDGKEHPWKTALLYAQSADGVVFCKPETGISNRAGDRTNIVMGYQDGVEPSGRNPWARIGVHSNGIVIDPYPPTPAERFRTIFSEGTHEAGRLRHKTTCAHSPDGLTWTRYPWYPSIGSTGGNLNDVSCLHYDHDARLFVQNTRDHRMYDVAFPPRTPQVSHWFGPVHPGRPDLMGRRRVVQTRSPDFRHWTEPVLVSAPDDAGGGTVSCDNLDVGHYGMQQFRVGRMHFATLGILRYVADEMEVRLLYSRDGRSFLPADRGTAFLAPRGPGHWDAHMVSMTSQPIEVGDEWFFYHGGARVHHDWWSGPPEGIDHPDARDPGAAMRDGFGLGLARLRKEGFASLDGSRQREGYLLTKPFKSAGNRLTINARCRSGGSIAVGVLDTDRNPLPGRGPEQSDCFTADATAHPVTWGSAADMGRPGAWRQLLFVIRDAELFSFRCCDT